MTVAYCWRGGVIEFGRRCPAGALNLLRGPDKRVREIVNAAARHAYDGVTLLVPGIPEADSDEDAVAAAVVFTERLVNGAYPGAIARGDFRAPVLQ